MDKKKRTAILATDVVPILRYLSGCFSSRKSPQDETSPANHRPHKDHHQTIEHPSLESRKDENSEYHSPHKDHCQAIEGPRTIDNVESDETHCPDVAASIPVNFLRTPTFKTVNTIACHKYRDIVILAGPSPKDRNEIEPELDRNCQTLESVPIPSNPKCGIIPPRTCWYIPCDDELNTNAKVTYRLKTFPGKLRQRDTSDESHVLESC